MADDETGDDTTTADRPASAAQPGVTLPTPPLVSLTPAPPSAQAVTTAPPVDVDTDAVEASAVPGSGPSVPDLPGTDADNGRQATAPATTLASAQTPSPTTDFLDLAPDQTDESQDVPLMPQTQGTRAGAAPAEKGTEVITTTPPPSTDVVDKRTTAMLPQATGQAAVADGGKPAAGGDNLSTAHAAPATDPAQSTPIQNDSAAPTFASSASSASDQARTMLKAALATHGAARQAGASSTSSSTSTSLSTGTPSSAQNGAPVANQAGSSTTTASVPAAAVTSRPTAPPPPPAPDDSSSRGSSGSGHDSAALSIAAMARTQSSDGDSLGASAGDARGQSNTSTSGGVFAGPGAALASGASPLGASFSLPLAAAGQPGAAAGAQAPGLTSQTDATLPGQIVQAIRMQWQNGIGQATIHLDPAHLGELTVSLRVDQGTVSAQLHADTPEVRAWIQQHAHDLRGALEQQGLRLGQMTVAAVDPDGARQRQANDHAPQRGRRPIPANGARFTVEA